MKGTSIRLVLLISFFTSVQASAALLFSTSFSDWETDQQTLLSGQLHREVYKTDYTNIAAISSQAFSALPDPTHPDYESTRMDWQFSGNNVDLGHSVDFASSQTGLSRSFRLSTLETDTVTASGSHYHGTQYSAGDTARASVIFNDRIDRNNFEQNDAFTNALSIGKHKGYDTDEVLDGDPYSWDNDDFQVEMTSGPALYAFAFQIINNKKYLDTSINPQNPSNSDGGLYSYGRESISVIDALGNQIDITEQTGGMPVIPGYYDDPLTQADEGKYSDNFDDVQFIGIVSDIPIISFTFNEDSRSDDIAIRDLQFVGVAPVPLPAGVWLLISSLGILLTQRCRVRSMS